MTINKNGWDSITEAIEKVYPNPENLNVHYKPVIPISLGGNSPLDGVSIYETNEFYHFITYGFSNLYDEGSEEEYSGLGFELTLKLKKYPDLNEDELPCIVNILQELARYIFNSNRVFREDEYIYTGQTQGIDCLQESKITGFVTALDDDLGEIQTVNGKIEFIQLIGLTNKELLSIHNFELSIREVMKKLGSRLTDYNRDELF